MLRKDWFRMMNLTIYRPAFRLSEHVAVFAGDIKLSHSVFAMPFALLAAFLASAYVGHLPDVLTVVLIILCMVLARTMAMAVNRWADASLDSLNPRTRHRAIPAGRLSSKFVLITAILCGAGFILVTSGFWFRSGNVYPLVLSPIVLVWLVAYSYTKRFTSLCHVVLGIALAISPLAAGIAVAPIYLTYWEPYFLAAMVMCWVAGFDVIYAIQDVEVDRDLGVFSLPARVGVRSALWISRGLHLCVVILLIALYQVSPFLGHGFAVGVGIVVLLLVVEHALVWYSSIRHIYLFLTLNGLISLLLGGLGMFDIVGIMRY